VRVTGGGRAINVYGAAKGMVGLFLPRLRNRLNGKGIQVITVKPGFVDTPMTAAFEKKGLLWAQPDQIAKGIVAPSNTAATWFTCRGSGAGSCSDPAYSGGVFKRMKL